MPACCYPLSRCIVGMTPCNPATHFCGVTCLRASRRRPCSCWARPVQACCACLHSCIVPLQTRSVTLHVCHVPLAGKRCLSAYRQISTAESRKRHDGESEAITELEAQHCLAGRSRRRKRSYSN